MEFTTTEGEEMFRYTFRVECPFGYELTDVISDSIENGLIECRKRSRRDTTSISLVGSFDLQPQVCLGW